MRNKGRNFYTKSCKKYRLIFKQVRGQFYQNVENIA